MRGPVWRQDETLTHKQPTKVQTFKLTTRDPLDARTGDRDGTSFGRILNSPDLSCMAPSLSYYYSGPPDSGNPARETDRQVTKRGAAVPGMFTRLGVVFDDTQHCRDRTHFGSCLNSYRDGKSADRKATCDSLEKANDRLPGAKGKDSIMDRCSCRSSWAFFPSSW